MMNLLINIVDYVKGKERADWVVQTWLRDHADEYQTFVAGIERMAEGDMTAAYNMYKVIKEYMPPEAEQYYDILLRAMTDEPTAFQEMMKLKHADEIGNCAIHGNTLEINIGTGEVIITDNPRSDRLTVNVSNITDRWQHLSLYTKAYCKDCFERFKESLPVAMQPHALDIVIKMIKIHYVANLVFMPGLMANLYDKAILGNDGMLFAMYYFVTYDHGLQRMALIFSRVVSDEVPGVDGVTVFKSTIHNLTMTSLTYGWETKETWTKVADRSNNDEAWKEIMHAVRTAKSKHGKPVEQRTIDDLLRCRNKEEAKTLMMEFLKEHDGLFGLAYLRWVLDRTGCIKDVPYMVFHRAMEVMLGEQIGYKKPQERYGLLNKQYHEQEKHIRIWKDVDKIMRKWQPRFGSLR